MRVLICGGSHADIPQINALVRLGHWVATTGKYEHELGHSYSDAYIPADYSDPDAIWKIIKDNAIDAVIPCCNDFSYITCAQIAPLLKQSGFDSLETARKIHDKDAFRELCRSLDIATPRVLATWPSKKNLPDSFVEDVIVKPVDLSGGKGMTRLAAGEHIANAINFAIQQSKARRVVIEEFVNGSNHGLSTIIIGGKVCFSFVDNEHYFLNPFLVSGASSSSTARPEVTSQLIADIEKLSHHLKLVDGLIHCQFIQTNIGYRLLEICRRPPGDLYTRFVELATGIPYPAILVRLYLGEQLSNFKIKTEFMKRNITRHCAMAKKTGSYVGLSIDQRLEVQVIESLFLLKPGDAIIDATVQKAAIVFIDNKEIFSVSGEDLHSYISVIVK
jgi:biotin carboxylase